MTSVPQPARLRFGTFEVVLKSHELFKHGIRIKIQDQPFRILAMLLERPGEMVTREELRKALWAQDTFVDFDAGLNAAIRRLRDALSDSSEETRYIETLPRHGYRFIASVESIPAATSEQNAVPRGSAPEIVTIAAEPVRRLPWQWATAVAAVLILAAVVGGVARRSYFFSTHASPGIRSLAVLPLQNLSGDPAQDYFADGMTDALIADLTKLGSLRVISRTSAMHYKGTHQSLPEIARELKVEAVVEGSVERSVNRVRIRAQLIDAANDKSVWARDFDRPMQDVLQLQSEVATAVALEIAGKLTTQQRTSLTEARPVNPEAYEDYLRGRFFEANVRTTEGLQKAEGYLLKAIQEDPNYAPPYVLLSDLYCKASFSVVGWMDPRVAGPKAVAAANKAVQLDGHLAEAHVAVATALSLYQGKAAATLVREETERAIQINPNSFAGLLASADLLENPQLACQKIRAAYQLDPINPDRFREIANCLWDEGKYEEAIEEARQGVELFPRNVGAHNLLAGFYERRSHYPEAIAEIKKYSDLGGLCAEEALIHALAGAGRRTEAERMVAKREKENDWDLWCSAVAYIGLGRYDDALRALEKDFAGGGSIGSMRVTGMRWEFEPLRPDPRFQKLLKRGEEPY